MNQDTILTKKSLTTPRAAAIAGILFSILLIISLAQNLVPFAGIAFLWFIGVVRDRLGAYEDRLFATVFLGSGLLFLASLFISTAIAGGILIIYGSAPALLIDSGLYTFGRTVSYEILNVYAIKMAGVFMITTCTLSLRTGIIPRWMAYLGLILALFLLLSSGYVSWAMLVFPLWVFLISMNILVSNLGKPKSEFTTSTQP